MIKIFSLDLEVMCPHQSWGGGGRGERETPACPEKALTVNNPSQLLYTYTCTNMYNIYTHTNMIGSL